VSHEDVLVLVYSGSYSAALELRSRLQANGIRSSFDDIPLGPPGQPDSRIFVALGDVERALPLIADFRANNSTT
jgi:hypothetical protein